MPDLQMRVFSSARQVSTVNHHGTREQKINVTFDEGLYKKAMERIARGMYWKISGLILGAKSEIEIIVDGELTQKLNSLASQCGEETASAEVNGGTFKCELKNVAGMKIMRMYFFNAQFGIALL